MRYILIPVCVLLLSGCAQKEPYHRTDVWYPTGANEGNIAAMAVNPLDLVHGRGTTMWVPAAPYANAVDRVWADHPKALPNNDPTAKSGGSTPPAGGSN
jgi:type IV pilus biogenesis protein CpaD/CtpE